MARSLHPQQGARPAPNGLARDSSALFVAAPEDTDVELGQEVKRNGPRHLLSLKELPLEDFLFPGLGQTRTRSLHPRPQIPVEAESGNGGGVWSWGWGGIFQLAHWCWEKGEHLSAHVGVGWGGCAEMGVGTQFHTWATLCFESFPVAQEWRLDLASGRRYQG